MHIHSRSAFHVRTGDRRVAEAADAWLCARGFESVVANDVYDACTQLINGAMVSPTVVLVGLDGVDADELAILDYLRKLHPDATVFAYGTARGMAPARNIRGVSVAADWSNLESLLTAWLASRERHFPEQRELIFDDARSSTIHALRELQATSPARFHCLGEMNGATNGKIAISSAHSNGSCTCEHGAANGRETGHASIPLSKSVGTDATPADRRPTSKHGAHATSRSPVRAVLTLAERAALLGLEPASV